MTVRTRFAPSPTGALHIGGVRTALFSWLYARRHGGQYVLRIEDTDVQRSTQDAVQGILEAFEWLGLAADEGPYFQSRRFERYREVAAQMIADGLAYRCYCSPEELAQMRAEQTARGEKPRYDGRCRERVPLSDNAAAAVRFRNPAEGEVVVDDADMRITHVIRGDDHLNNTPRHINLFEALKWPAPRYAHIPMIAGPDGAKLSKRHGAVSVLEYREQGYLPEALLNYLVRLGWSHGDQELFTRDEMIALFDLSAVQKSPARFDAEKLNWLNQQYIKAAPSSRLAGDVAKRWQAPGVSAPALEPIVDAFRERAKTLQELADKARVYVTDDFDYEPKAAQKQLHAGAGELLRKVRDVLAGLSEWTEDATQAGVERVAHEAGTGLGKVAQPLRVAVTGDVASPGIGVTLHILGRDKTLARIDRAIRYIDERAPRA